MLNRKAALWAVLVAFLVGLGLVIGGITLWMTATRRPAIAGFSGPAVVQQVQSLAHLVTVKYVMEKVVVLDDPKFFGGIIPLGENRIILLAHGNVKAGVDLSQLQESDVEIKDRSISITLPPAVVTDAYLVEQYTQVIDWQTGALRAFDKTLEQTARRVAVAEISRGARRAGIEKEANERAQAQMKSFLRLAGFETVNVKTRGAALRNP